MPVRASGRRQRRACGCCQCFVAWRASSAACSNPYKCSATLGWPAAAVRSASDGRRRRLRRGAARDGVDEPTKPQRETQFKRTQTQGSKHTASRATVLLSLAQLIFGSFLALLSTRASLRGLRLLLRLLLRFLLGLVLRAFRCLLVFTLRILVRRSFLAILCSSAPAALFLSSFLSSLASPEPVLAVPGVTFTHASSNDGPVPAILRIGSFLASSALNSAIAHSQRRSRPPFASRDPSGRSNQQNGDDLCSANFCCCSSVSSALTLPRKSWSVALRIEVEPGLVRVGVRSHNGPRQLTRPICVVAEAKTRDANPHLSGRHWRPRGGSL